MNCWRCFQTNAQQPLLVQHSAFCATTSPNRIKNGSRPNGRVPTLAPRPTGTDRKHMDPNSITSDIKQRFGICEGMAFRHACIRPMERYRWLRARQQPHLLQMVRGLPQRLSVQMRLSPRRRKDSGARNRRDQLQVFAGTRLRRRSPWWRPGSQPTASAASGWNTLSGRTDWWPRAQRYASGCSTRPVRRCSCLTRLGVHSSTWIAPNRKRGKHERHAQPAHLRPGRDLAGNTSCDRGRPAHGRSA